LDADQDGLRSTWLYVAAAPDVLDIGSGTGAQSLVLAAATDGRIVAADLFGDFLGRLRERAGAMGLGSRVAAVVADMGRLPFASDSFDLIWSKGAAYAMGLDAALTTWRTLARPAVYLVVSELSWFRPDPPEEIREFWQRHYPAVRRVEDNLAAAKQAGWVCVDYFHLPATAWDRYHAPLMPRLPVFRRSRRQDPDAQAFADLTEQEIRLMRDYADTCGCELVVLRRRE
jgi:SAM-dependent methyltransferase